MMKTASESRSLRPGLNRYLETLRYALHVIVRPFDGFWDLSREKRGSVAAANTIILLALITRVLKLQYTSFQFLVVHWENVSVIREMLSIYLPLLIWCCSNWCWTTLFDGKGSFRDVYMSMGYAITPYVLLQLPMILLSNMLTVKEGAFWGVLHVVSLLWCAALFVIAMMQIHDFSPGKTILFTVMSLFGMLIIVFLLLLLFSLLGDAVGYFVALYREILFRLN